MLRICKPPQVTLDAPVPIQDMAAVPMLKVPFMMPTFKSDTTITSNEYDGLGYVPLHYTVPTFDSPPKGIAYTDDTKSFIRFAEYATNELTVTEVNELGLNLLPGAGEVRYATDQSCNCFQTKLYNRVDDLTVSDTGKPEALAMVRISNEMEAEMLEAQVPILYPARISQGLNPLMYAVVPIKTLNTITEPYKLVKIVEHASNCVYSGEALYRGEITGCFYLLYGLRSESGGTRTAATFDPGYKIGARPEFIGYYDWQTHLVSAFAGCAVSYDLEVNPGDQPTRLMFPEYYAATVLLYKMKLWPRYKPESNVVVQMLSPEARNRLQKQIAELRDTKPNAFAPEIYYFATMNCAGDVAKKNRYYDANYAPFADYSQINLTGNPTSACGAGVIQASACCSLATRGIGYKAISATLNDSDTCKFIATRSFNIPASETTESCNLLKTAGFTRVLLDERIYEAYKNVCEEAGLTTVKVPCNGFLSPAEDHFDLWPEYRQSSYEIIRKVITKVYDLDYVIDNYMDSSTSRLERTRYPRSLQKKLLAMDIATRHMYQAVYITL